MIFSRVIKNIKGSVVFNYNRNKLFYNSNLAKLQFNKTQSVCSFNYNRNKLFYNSSLAKFQSNLSLATFTYNVSKAKVYYFLAYYENVRPVDLYVDSGYVFDGYVSSVV